MQVDAAKNPVRLQLNAGQAQGLSEGAQLAIYPPGKTIHEGEIEQAAQAV